jgi:hypothetical protein
MTKTDALQILDDPRIRSAKKLRAAARALMMVPGWGGQEDGIRRLLARAQDAERIAR